MLLVDRRCLRCSTYAGRCVFLRRLQTTAPPPAVTAFSSNADVLIMVTRLFSGGEGGGGGTGQTDRRSHAAFTEARLRLKRTVTTGINTATSTTGVARAAAAAKRAEVALADFLLDSITSSHASPALLAVVLGAVDIAAASASPRALASFASVLWAAAAAEDGAVLGVSSLPLVARIARRLLGESQLYELASLRMPLAVSATTTVLVACVRAISAGAHVLSDSAAASCVAALELTSAAAADADFFADAVEAAAVAAAAISFLVFPRRQPAHGSAAATSCVLT